MKKNTIGIPRDMHCLTLLAKTLAACAFAATLGGCGGGGSSSFVPDGPDINPPPPSRFTVGGTVQGLEGTGLTLKNGNLLLPILNNGAFEFAPSVPAGTAFAVTVESEPKNPGQQCKVENGAGTVTAAVTGIRVTCTTPQPAPGVFTLGGNVKGLQGTGLVLQNKGALLPISGNGAFTFPELVFSGALFDVIVATQPSSPTQECKIVNGTGAATANVTSIQVNCGADAEPPPQLFTIGGTVQGLQGTGLVLGNNGSTRGIASSGGFTFPVQMPAGSKFDVVVITQPTSPAQHCAVENGTGIVTSHVTDVRVICAAELVLTDSAPAAGAEEVDRSVRPLLHFSAVLDPATVTAANVRLASPGGPANLAMAILGDSVSMRPGRKLLPATPYQLSVNNLGGMNGESHDPLHVDFLTADAAWQPLIEIENAAHTVDDPQIAVGANGAAFAVWTHFDAVGVKRVWVSRYDTAAQAWTPKQALNPTHLFGADEPQIAVSAAGDAFVVWHTLVQPQGDVPLSTNWVARYDANTGIWKDELLSDFHADEPQIAVDDAGNALAVWRQDEPVLPAPRERLVARRYIAGSGWEPPVPPHKVTVIDSPAHGHSATPRIAMTANGRAVVGWLQQVSKGAAEMHVWANTFDGSAWGQPARIDMGYASSAQHAPRMAIDEDGNALAVWRQTDSSAFNRVVSNRFAAGTGWGAIAAPISPAAVHGIEPRIAVDRHGNAVAVWLSVTPEAATFLVANHFDVAALAWDTEVSVLADDEVDQLAPDLVVDAAGNALVIFHVEKSEAAALVTAAKRYVAHKASWEATTELSRSIDIVSTPPMLAIDRQGDGWALFVQFDLDFLNEHLMTVPFK